jgi:tRNA(Ile)-lysidine synthase
MLRKIGNWLSSKKQLIYYMSLLHLFQEFIIKENLFSPKDKLLLAVSGGVDSVVLCELCQLAGYDFVIAHCNFQLRGQESEKDERFVRSLGEKYAKEVLVKRFETEKYASEKKISIQVAARELRYEWFFGLVDSHQPGVKGNETNDSPLTTHHSPLTTHLLTAHHLDDNIETMLLNFFKGTGIAGLRGMLPKQGKLLRPLLFAKKEELKKFAGENQLSWTEDSSNQSNKYSRNYFRNQVIPLIQNIYPEAEKNLANNLQRFRDIEMLYYQSVDLHKKKLLVYKNNEVYIPVLKLKKAEPLVSVVYEIIKDYHFSSSQVHEVIVLLDNETGKYVQSATHRVIKNRNWIIISPNQTTASANILIEAPGVTELGIGNLELRVLPNYQLQIPASSNIACLNAAQITFPLLLRAWKAGDYFYPLGMKKKKKLSRFFIDQKLSKTDKEKVWVLEMNKKIVWVLGYRIDDRFKITPGTKEILQAELKAAKI